MNNKEKKIDIKAILLLTTTIILASLTGYFAYQNNHIETERDNNVNQKRQNEQTNFRKNNNHKQQNNNRKSIADLPKEDLSDAEKDSLLKMIQDEKLARDVYTSLYKKWNLEVFNNISKAEQRHMNAIIDLLQKYELKNPVENLNEGEFADTDFADLYKNLVEQGNQSEVEALKVGATIEDLDIADLDEYLSQVDNQDITQVYTYLKNGSKNHLRAFINNLKEKDENYKAQYISEEEFNSILNNSQ